MEFGDILWTIVLIIAGFGGGLVKLFGSKNQVDSEESAQPASYPAWEAEADDFEEEIEEVPEENPYFTYEMPEQTYAPAAASVPHEPMAPAVPEAVQANEAFDLRKAIIYQTILQNNYSHFE